MKMCLWGRAQAGELKVISTRSELMCSHVLCQSMKVHLHSLLSHPHLPLLLERLVLAEQARSLITARQPFNKSLTGFRLKRHSLSKLYTGTMSCCMIDARCDRLCPSCWQAEPYRRVSMQWNSGLKKRRERAEHSTSRCDGSVNAIIFLHSCYLQFHKCKTHALWMSWLEWSVNLVWTAVNRGKAVYTHNKWSHIDRPSS